MLTQFSLQVCLPEKIELKLIVSLKSKIYSNFSSFLCFLEEVIEDIKVPQYE